MKFTASTADYTLTAGESIPQFSRVRIDATGEARLAGAVDGWVGVAVQTAAVGERVAVLSRNQAGSVGFIAAGAVTIGAPLYPAASGRVTATAPEFGPPIGVALGAASGAGAFIEATMVSPFGPLLLGRTATGAGPIDFDTRLGVNPSYVQCVIRNASGNQRLATTLSYPSAGVVRVADAGLATGDQVALTVWR